MAAPLVRTRATAPITASRPSATQRTSGFVPAAVGVGVGVGVARPRLLLSSARLPPCRRRHAAATTQQQAQASSPTAADAGEPDALELQYGWKGADVFSPLGDRADAPPPPLPPVRGRVRVVLVRHGQSTWNAEGRVQGSSDGSELTDKGKAQARAAGEMLANEHFSRMFVSPLRRARQTAEAIAGRHPPPPHSSSPAAAAVPAATASASATTAATSTTPATPAPPPSTLADAAVVLPSLREIDLYAFQGLLKARGKARHGAAYAVWQRSPELFELEDGDEIGSGNKSRHAPVRELWYRAGLAWREILAEAAAAAGPGGEGGGEGGGGGAVLVVAHNAVNQALIGSALGLGPEHFRRLQQSNGAATVVDFAPGGGGSSSSDGAPARASLDRLNATAGGALAASLARVDAKTSARVVLVRPGKSEEATAAALAATLAPALAAGARVAAVLSSPEDDAAAAEIARSLVAGDSALQHDDNLAPPRDGETRAAFWRRCGRAWRRAVAAGEAEAAAAAAIGGGGGDERPPALVVVVSASPGTLAAVVGHALSSSSPDDADEDALGPQARACLGGGLRFSRGGATVVDVAARDKESGRPPAPAAVVRTLNASLLGGVDAMVARRGEPLPEMPEALLE